MNLTKFMFNQKIMSKFSFLGSDDVQRTNEISFFILKDICNKSNYVSFIFDFITFKYNKMV